MGKSVRLLKIDENGIVAFEKPIDVLSHPNKNDNGRARLLKGFYNHSFEAYDFKNYEADGKLLRLWLINRIDFQTSGIVLGSTNYDVAKVIKSLFKSRKVSKTYFAVVNGSSHLLCNKKKNIENGKFVEWVDTMQTGRQQEAGLGDGIARTTVRIVKENIRENRLLLELHPATGFKHQLRYQCAIRGLPIVGDRIYGDFHLNKTLSRISPSKHTTRIENDNTISSQDDESTSRTRLYLHSSALDVKYNFNNILSHFSVESPIPETFLRIVS